MKARMALVFLAVVGGLLLEAAPARPDESSAEAPADLASADAAFVEGRRLLAEGDLPRACAKLEESHRRAPSGRAVLNLADCLERRGLTASARERFFEAATRAAAADLPEVARHARERAASLESRIGWIRLVVPPASDLPGMIIQRNGAPVARSHLNAHVAFDPGTVHTFLARAPGKSPVTASVTARAGVRADVELVWHDPPLRAVASPPARAERSSSAASTSRTLGWATLGGGAVATAVGIFSGLTVLDARDTIAAHCDPASRLCDDGGADAASRGAVHEIVAPIAFAVGAVALGAGAYLLLRDGAPRAVAQ